MNTYQEQQKSKIYGKLDNLLLELPECVTPFFTYLKNNKQPRTALGYAQDIRLFFIYLKSKKNIPLKDISLDMLENIQTGELEDYIAYLSNYQSEAGERINNTTKGKQRKISCLRSFYNYFAKRDLIKRNPTLALENLKTQDKEITYLTPDEVARFLDNIETGANLSKNMKSAHEKTMLRDLAIFTLLLGTGIRISELVGLNLSDIDFNDNSIMVLRKGGAIEKVYFGKEVADALANYINHGRINVLGVPWAGDENALFLSLKHNRISVRAVQKLCQKYNITSKHITPHSMRATCGSDLYAQSGDIYLTAAVLGHASVDTTKRHYAKMAEERKRQAIHYIQLRYK